jgi:hypothetical protein
MGALLSDIITNILGEEQSQALQDMHTEVLSKTHDPGKEVEFLGEHLPQPPEVTVTSKPGMTITKTVYPPLPDGRFGKTVIHLQSHPEQEGHHGG